MTEKADSISRSRFWRPLWKVYSRAPSIALCRVPELEYASGLNVTGRVLDHCCGDGMFASLAWPGRRLTAGCDQNPESVERARRSGLYARVDVCDASKRLPYEDQSFDRVFDNSALEHIQDLDAALSEVARVLTPGGIFAFNVLNHRYFEWWPLDNSSLHGYRNWQPFFHAFDRKEWERRLAHVGLQVVSIDGYFDQCASRELALLDCEFSGVYLGRRRSQLVWWHLHLLPLMQWYWRWRLSSLVWKTAPDSGAGYFIQAVRRDG
jgi:SAM-dependent methyltransferase